MGRSSNYFDCLLFLCRYVFKCALITSIGHAICTIATNGSQFELTYIGYFTKIKIFELLICIGIIQQQNRTFLRRLALIYHIAAAEFRMAVDRYD